ncbi:IclR family transcriptional regulator domain-containing protein [Streptomyces sp. NPDC002143]
MCFAQPTAESGALSRQLAGELRERVLTGPLTRSTRHTPDTPEGLRAELADIRRQGYAFCPGYVHEDALGIAAPIRDGKGSVVAALAVIVPDDAGARAMVPVVRTAALGVSRTLAASTCGLPAAKP